MSDPFESIVQLMSEAEGISRFRAATKLAVMSVAIEAHEDAEKFAEIARERMRAGEKE